MPQRIVLSSRPGSLRRMQWVTSRAQTPLRKKDGSSPWIMSVGKACTGQVLPFKYTAVPAGNLDQRWGHGIWVGKAPMTDEHITLTENGVQTARSLYRVPFEERFVISYLKKVRVLPWNGRADTLKATIVTQQDQGPSGHRRMYLTTKVVAKFGATPGCSDCDGVRSHTEGCRIRLEKALADEKASAGVLGAGVGPIAEPVAESQQPAPAQQESAFPSSCPAVPMPSQIPQNEQPDSQMEMGAQERRGSTAKRNAAE